MDTHLVNQSVREVGATCVRLRDDLRFTPQQSGGQPYYMVEDPLNSRFFRLGHAEYTLVSLLDGNTTIDDALSQLSTIMPHHRLSEMDAAGLCRWLVELDLAYTETSSQVTRLVESASTAQKRKMAAKMNPLIIRIPLFRPDQVFEKLNRIIGWIYSPAAMIASLVLILVGGYHIAARLGTVPGIFTGIVRRPQLDLDGAGLDPVESGS